MSDAKLEVLPVIWEKETSNPREAERDGFRVMKAWTGDMINTIQVR